MRRSGGATGAPTPTEATPATPGSGSGTPGPATPGPATPGPATPGPATPGPATPGSASGTPATPKPAAPPRPKARVRTRLIVAVAVVAAAVAGAGAPAIVAASGQLNDSQSLVTLSELTQRAVTLSHSLADERDEVTAYIAAGRPDGKGLSESRSARVDRQIEELRAAAADASTNSSVTAGLRRDLADLGSVRRASLTGKSGPLDAHKAYTKAITELHGLSRELAEKLPRRAGSGAAALADLDHAVDQAGAARGLLLAALAVPRPTATGVTDPVTGLPTTGESALQRERRDGLSAAAQQARVRELAALADFQDTAPAKDRATYESTVTGSEVTTAEQYLERLTDEPTLSPADRRLNRGKLDTALSARVEAMRGAENALAAARTKSLAGLRDDDVTDLELRIALVGALLLLAVGVSMGAARSLTRPLAALRLGAARVAAAPASEEPVRFKGRDDEFAAVVRSVNALHGHAVAVQERLSTLEADRKHLIGQRQTMADARQALAEERDALRAELAEAAANLERVRRSIHGTFVNLALRTLGLVERQLAVIEQLEEREQDPDRLATLFKLDHLATVTRRHSENLLVLAGADHGHQHAGPVPLVDVVRAAVSEIERYERVRISALPPHAHLAGFAADDISHLVAELLENATSFSPPESSVEVSGWLLENGEVMLSVQDEGIGASVERLRELNARLTDFSADDAYDQEGGDGLGLGLYVVARLASRHGARVRLREQKQGGVTAVVVLPKGILTDAPPAPVPAPRGEAPRVRLPGSQAEANSNELPDRLGGRDPLIDAAETTLELLAPSVGTDHPDAAEPHARPDDEVRPEQSARPKARARDEASSGAAALLDPEPLLEADTPPRPQGPSGERDASSGKRTVSPDARTEPRTESGAELRRTESGAEPRTEPPTEPRTTPGTTPRTESSAAPRTPGATEDTVAATEPGPQVYTAKGLPKRTPRISPIAGTAPGPRSTSVDAEDLRRRLGGFQKGARSGRRDVEAELAESRRAEGAAAGTESAARTASTADVPGDPVEEASS
ncbi:nitrate- and nitrite sensing domain-containing protein [Streptomyces sp. G45]|uniref:sensor histidine kinase n=1 Tax=Streptomyces sp. G45 TaxID=3406627 RepID=UPI003C18C159